MPFPVAHALLGASIIVAGSQQPISRDRAGLRKLALGAFLGVLPDFDFLGVWFLNLDKSWHRGFTHSLFAAIVVGTLVSLWTTKNSRFRWSIVYGTALASHGLLDALLSVRTGAALLWPITSDKLAAGLFEYPEFIDVRYFASADLLAIKGGVQLLEFSAIEFIVLGALLILTWNVKRGSESRYDNKVR